MDLRATDCNHFCMDTRKRIKVFRRKVGFSQVRLANVAGISRFRLTLWEAGEGPLRRDELRRLDDALERLASERIKHLQQLSAAGKRGMS